MIGTKPPGEIIGWFLNATKLSYGNRGNKPYYNRGDGMQRFVSSVIIMLFLLLLPSWTLHATRLDEVLLQKEELQFYSLIDWEDGWIDWDKLDTLIDDLEQRVEQPPTNATLDENLEIIKETPGTTIDRTAFKKRFLTAYFEGETTSIQIPTKEVHARVDEEILRDITEKRLGTYTTFFNTTNKERSTNVKLAAEAIHGTVIFPGEDFSFNETVGERTEEKGYQRAPVIVKGEFAEDIGGGICQVSSTLFNTVDLRGIQIVERFTHSRSVPYVPPGRDATVSWWGPDFTFKNLYNEPVVIIAIVNNGNLTIELYSRDTVEYFKPDK
jgi:vancomycin resistance protein YoaR